MNYIMKCPCCGTMAMFLLKFPERHLFCAACGHRKKSFGPPKNYYKKLSGRSKMIGHDIKNKNAERIRFLRQYLVAGARVLEVGCAEGFLGEDIKKKFKVLYHGVEPSDDAVIAAKKLNKVWKSVEKVPLTARFDLIFLFHALEHVDNIKLLLFKLHKILDDDGIIIVETPYYSGNKFLPWDYNKEHIHIFNPASIARLFEKCEFNVRDVSTGHFESAIYSDSMRIVGIKRKKTNELKKDLIKRFKKYLGNHYLIYGTGGDFESLVRPYVKVADVSAIIDSSTKKNGKIILGKIIQSQRAINSYPNEKILIATYRYQEEIVKILKEMDIKKERIVTLSDILYE